MNLDQEVIGARYRWIETVVADVRRVSSAEGGNRGWTDRIDGILTHRFYGMGVFAIVMALLFEALFAWSEPFIGAIESATAALQTGVTAVLPEGPLQDLMVNGVIAGVGNVVVFVPQIAMLFLFIAVLEDVGYLARVAFVIDRLMGRVGLHGKAFVPMLSGFACAIPAVMATRTIESRRDRLITMLTLPMISLQRPAAGVRAGDGGRLRGRRARARPVQRRRRGAVLHVRALGGRRRWGPRRCCAGPCSRGRGCRWSWSCRRIASRCGATSCS